MDSIEEGKFSESTALETVKIMPSSNITRIENSAFYCCERLRSISIPEKVNYIGNHAFYGCGSLQSIDIPGKVPSIKYCTFDGCTSLRSISIPETVSFIEEGAFCHCISLQSIHISEGVTFIAFFAFYHCKSLRSIQLSDSVVIGKDAFDECEVLNQRLPIGRNYHQDTVTWLRQRFNDLPIHQACYRYGYTTSKSNPNHLSALINENKQSILDTDAMGMTALHILCCNPHATAEMVQLMVETDPSVLSLQDATGCTPVELFLICRGLLDLGRPKEEEFTSTNRLSPPLQDLLKKGIKSEDLHIVFILNKDLQADVSNTDKDTGLTPFLAAVTSPDSKLDVVYTLAMRNFNIL